MNIQSMFLGFVLLMGIMTALSFSPLFPDNTPYTGMPTDGLTTYENDAMGVMSLLTSFDLTTAIVGAIIFTFMIVTKAYILGMYGGLLIAGNSFITQTLSTLNIDTYFIEIVRVMFIIIIVLGVIQYLNGRRVEQT